MSRSFVGQGLFKVNVNSRSRSNKGQGHMERYIHLADYLCLLSYDSC